MLTYNNNLLHSVSNYTPKRANKQHNKLEVYENLQLNAKTTCKYLSCMLEIRCVYAIGGSHLTSPTCLYGPNQAYKLEQISPADGLTFYRTSAEKMARLGNGALNSTSSVYINKH